MLNEAAKENTVTVVHLIYRSKLLRIIVEGLRFLPHVGMVEHWIRR
jgi:NTE family protein